MGGETVTQSDVYPLPPQHHSEVRENDGETAGRRAEGKVGGADRGSEEIYIYDDYIVGAKRRGTRSVAPLYFRAYIYKERSDPPLSAPQTGEGGPAKRGEG